MHTRSARDRGSDRRRRAALAFGALLATAALAACGGGSSPATPAATQAATAPAATAALPLSTAPAPWPAPADVLPHIEAAGLPALGGEQLAYHVHAHLDVVVNGSAEPVPANIGIDYQRQRISPLHTHDATGIIHIEAAAPATFTLGQFFTEWGVRLDASCVGGYCNSATQPVRVYVNGKPAAGDPRAIALTAHEEIAIVIGSQSDVPSSFDFPAGD
jgi:hypothetical protein